MPVAFSCLAPMLGVRDLRKTIEFYTRAFGFVVTGTFEHEGRAVWAEFASDARSLMRFVDAPLMCNEIPTSCIVAGDRETKKNVLFYFRTLDVAALRAELHRRGFATSDLRVTVYGMKEFEMEDPDGYQLWFGEPTDEPPTVQE